MPDHDAPASSRRHEEGLRFVRRMHLPRTVGLALGGVAIGTVLWTRGAHPLAWVALAASALLWPHVADALGLRSADPYRSELRSLTIDSALGGAWIAMMQFNLLPSVVLLAMLSMDKMAVGGARFLARTSLALGLACTLDGRRSDILAHHHDPTKGPEAEPGGRRRRRRRSSGWWRCRWACTRRCAGDPGSARKRLLRRRLTPKAIRDSFR